MKKEETIRCFEETCTELAAQVNARLFGDSRNWYWVGGQVGGLCDFDDSDLLTPDEMYLILVYDVEYDLYADWRDWNMQYSDVIHRVNLWSWLHGFDVVAKKMSDDYEKSIHEGE